MVSSMSRDIIDQDAGGMASHVRSIYSNLHPDVDNSRFKIRFQSIVSGPYTKVFRCELIGSNLPCLFIKDKRKTDGDKDTQREYVILERLWGLGYDSEMLYRVPRPLDYDEERNLLVTEFVPGKKLSRLLAFNLRYPICLVHTGKSVRFIQSSARWLANYEGKVYDSTTSDLSGFVRGYLDYKIDEISFMPDENKDRIRASLEPYESSTEKIPVLLTNMDFKPHNVMIDGQTTFGIDWEKMKEDGAAFWMVASFLRSLEGAKAEPLVSNKVVDRLRAEFLSTYWQHTPFVDDRHIFPLVSTLESLTYLAEFKPHDGRHASICEHIYEHLMLALNDQCGIGKQ